MRKYISLLIIGLVLIWPTSVSAEYRKTGLSFSFGPQVQSYHYGRSVFYHNSNGIVYSRSYNRRTIRDLVGLCQHMGMRSFYFLPRGHRYAIPSHLREYAYYRFVNRGIYVDNYRPRRHYYSPHRHSPHQGGIYFRFSF